MQASVVAGVGSTPVAWEKKFEERCDNQPREIAEFFGPGGAFSWNNERFFDFAALRSG
jgi:hypothetical protein